MAMFDTIRRLASQRAHYNRTVREIRNMPHDIALDLGIDTTDAERLARTAVYGA